jgi:hypothetical protein
MIGGKGKGRGGAIVSLVVEEMRSRCSAAEADAAIEAFLRGDPMSESDRTRVVEVLVEVEARARVGRLPLQECESGEGASS